MIRGREGDEEYSRELERKWRKRKKVKRGILIGILIALVIAGLAAFLTIRFNKFTSYELKKETELSQGSLVGYEYFGDSVLKYSHDGASYISRSGENLWVDSFEMNQPMCYVSGDFACIADIKGNSIMIYNLSGRIGSVVTNLPITKAVVSETGVCATVEENLTSAFINFYQKTGEPIDISIKNLIADNGYPTDIALSPEGTQLITAYTYLEGGAMKSKVVFYDFSEIGKNIPNRLVGAFEEPFENSLIARVRYVNSTYSYAIADTGIYFFSSKNISSPELVRETLISETIESVFTCKEHVGLLIRNDGVQEIAAADAQTEEAPAETGVDEETAGGPHYPYKLVLYNADGSEAMTRNLETAYDSVACDGDFIYLRAGEQLLILNKYGNVKFDGLMEDQAAIICHGNWPGSYIFSGNTYMREYRFK